MSHHHNTKKDNKRKKYRDLCVKNLKAFKIKCQELFTNIIITNNIRTNNIITNRINGTSVNGTNSIRSNGIITPVTYINGIPKQPDNNGSFNQQVLDELWKLNLLANAVTNLNTSSGRLRNRVLSNFYNCSYCPENNLNDCPCPTPGYALFKGEMSNLSLIHI